MGRLRELPLSVVADLLVWYVLLFTSYCKTMGTLYGILRWTGPIYLPARQLLEGCERARRLLRLCTTNPSKFCLRSLIKALIDPQTDIDAWYATNLATAHIARKDLQPTSCFNAGTGISGASSHFSSAGHIRQVCQA